MSYKIALYKVLIESKTDERVKELFEELQRDPITKKLLDKQAVPDTSMFKVLPVEWRTAIYKKRLFKLLIEPFTEEYAKELNPMKVAFLPLKPPKPTKDIYPKGVQVPEGYSAGLLTKM